MATYHKSLFMFIMTILFLFLSCVSSFSNGGITLNLHHRDASSRDDHFSRLRKAFHRSFSRHEALKTASLLGSRSKSLDSLGSTLKPIGGEYLMKVKIGTPPVEILAIADTGSDLTWTQCLPCTSCYSQKSPLFDPKKTSTYRPVSCSSKICRSEGLGSSCTDSNVCSYFVSYGDSSYSRGDLSSETFTFDSDNAEESLAIPKVVFGCGHDNGGTFNDTGSGIIGLGGGDVSIVRQLDKYINGRFSYCLTYLDSNVSSKISFGSNAVVSGPNVVSTPLVKKANSVSTFYYLTLEGISVGEKKILHTPSKHHRLDGEEITSVEQGNIIIDSGTTLTFIPQDLYKSVESELEKSMNGKRVDDRQGMFGLCYEVSSVEGVNVPQVVVHFTGADVALPQGAVFIEVEKGVACLTLVVSQELSIFGNLHQMNYHIGYDLENQKIDFLPTDCSKVQRY